MFRRAGTTLGMCHRPAQPMGMCHRPARPMGMCHRPARPLGTRCRAGPNRGYASCPGTTRGCALPSRHEPRSRISTGHEPWVRVVERQNTGFAPSRGHEPEVGPIEWAVLGHLSEKTVVSRPLDALHPRKLPTGFLAPTGTAHSNPHTHGNCPLDCRALGNCPLNSMHPRVLPGRWRVRVRAARSVQAGRAVQSSEDLRSAPNTPTGAGRGRPRPV
jgi:hypothetical protein